MRAAAVRAAKPSSETPLLEFDAVDYQYSCSLAPSIRQLSLRIPEGARCGLIGENGCGKTTLFLLANGLLRPQHGRIRWRGEPIAYQRQALAQLRQRVGLVFQNPEHQLVATSVAEDLSYGLVNLGMDDNEILWRVKQAIVHFDLEALVDRPVHGLSLGEKKQLSLADVMMLEPELLLLDEPTAYLSPGHCRELLLQLQRIHAAGTAIVVASHDLDFLDGWAEWLFVMDRGELVLEGPPAEVFAQRQHLEALNLGIPPRLALLKRWRELAQRHLKLPPVELEALERLLREPEQSDCNQQPAQTPGLGD
ncbi:energy-coupling factor ABC transporter ATP-binding protein [Synechococcus sp. CS-602]|uniref:energy-coupling factor ABC transporter ATP-binding protein n=1 Tax=Candidatus Regnicoccus frigidus TaxID=3074015 RepID=UPI0009FA18DE|nr:ABC transporter ATP-binding protein [Candidatus Regnicoccus frigidus]MCT0203515.1 energy-coupling factor ABC transporter ATP-binding protein [Synechococcus sp. CS-602]MCT0246261.1 energy-coupling factor ABC transporter ATP-binding protein [Synechococcus sp. CS-601]MCT4363849.1 energy-coupling factor ABC transporter ATP-binding protein [Candidatus Regnicoccus frigidus MAG-AL1]TWB87197.1 cobalt/nickel transport system ATP-binding protein [Synechococcus sp. Ace-Pa]